MTLNLEEVKEMVKCLDSKKESSTLTKLAESILEKQTKLKFKELKKVIKLCDSLPKGNWLRIALESVILNGSFPKEIQVVEKILYKDPIWKNVPTIDPFFSKPVITCEVK